MEGSDEESFVRMESKRSVEVLGVRIRVIDAARAERKAAFVAVLCHQFHQLRKNERSWRTLETSNLLADETLSNTFTHFLCNLLRDVLLHEMLFHALQDWL